MPGESCIEHGTLVDKALHSDVLRLAEEEQLVTRRDGVVTCVQGERAAETAPALIVALVLRLLIEVRDSEGEPTCRFVEEQSDGLAEVISGRRGVLPAAGPRTICKARQADDTEGVLQLPSPIVTVLVVHDLRNVECQLRQSVRHPHILHPLPVLRQAVYHGHMKKSAAFLGILAVSSILMAGCSTAQPAETQASGAIGSIAPGEPAPGTSPSPEPSASATPKRDALPEDIPLPSGSLVPGSLLVGDRTWEASFVGMPSDVQEVLFPNFTGSGYEVRVEEGIAVAENAKYNIRFGVPDKVAYPDAGYTAIIVEK